VVSLSAKGLTHGEICAHLAEVYGAEVSKDRITAITDRVMEGMAEWQNRPLEAVYPVVFIDCIHVKIRDGQVANRPIYVALAVTCDGGRDILGLWAGDGGEGAKFWLRVLTEIRNRGAGDVCMVVCDGLKGLPDAIGEVWPQAVVQTCIIHYPDAAIIPTPGAPALVTGGARSRRVGIITAPRGRRAAGRRACSGQDVFPPEWSGQGRAA
jgi:transposase-like protein